MVYNCNSDQVGVGQAVAIAPLHNAQPLIAQGLIIIVSLGYRPSTMQCGASHDSSSFESKAKPESTRVF